MTQVLLADNDISAFVSAVPPSNLQAGEYGQITVNPIPSITGLPGSQLWNRQSQSSPFHGNDVQVFPVQINRSGQTVYTGHIGSVRDQVSGAAVQLRSTTQGLLERSSTFVASGVTPAAAALELLQLFKVPVDLSSFNSSDVYLTSKAISCRVVAFGDQTLNSVLQALAVVGLARIYLSEGLIRYETYQQFTSDPLVTFSDSVSGELTIWSVPVVETVQKSPTSGYSVTWDGTPDAVLGDEEEGTVRQISAGPADVVTLETFQSAVQVGEIWFDYLRQQQDKISFDVPPGIGKSLDIGYPVAVNWANWSGSITIDIQSIDTSRDDRTRITGLTR